LLNPEPRNRLIGSNAPNGWCPQPYIDRGKLLTVDTPAGLIEKHKDDPRVRKVAHGQATLDAVFIGLTGSELRD
jgi:hypothetical protein